MKTTYNKVEFQRLINVLLDNAGYKEDITFWLLKDQSAKKWYEKSYTSDFVNIEEDTIYGIYYDSMIQFEIKVGKIENLLKTFITQFSRKYKYLVENDGIWEYKQDKVCIQKKIIEHNQDRVDKGLFYTTLYGIGFWAILSSKKDKDIAKDLAIYLQNKNINYSNEFSDAGWVYRFKINKSIEQHNDLLNNFKTL